jgi:hypothetical protein
LVAVVCGYIWAKDGIFVSCLFQEYWKIDW